MNPSTSINLLGDYLVKAELIEEAPKCSLQHIHYTRRRNAKNRFRKSRMGNQKSQNG